MDEQDRDDCRNALRTWLACREAHDQAAVRLFQSHEALKELRGRVVQGVWQLSDGRGAYLSWTEEGEPRVEEVTVL